MQSTFPKDVFNIILSYGDKYERCFCCMLNQEGVIKCNCEMERYFHIQRCLFNNKGELKIAECQTPCDFGRDDRGKVYHCIVYKCKYNVISKCFILSRHKTSVSSRTTFAYDHDSDHRHTIDVPTMCYLTKHNKRLMKSKTPTALPNQTQWGVVLQNRIARKNTIQLSFALKNCVAIEPIDIDYDNLMFVYASIRTFIDIYNIK